MVVRDKERRRASLAGTGRFELASLLTLTRQAQIMSSAPPTLLDQAASTVSSAAQAATDALNDAISVEAKSDPLDPVTGTTAPSKAKVCGLNTSGCSRRAHSRPGRRSSSARTPDLRASSCLLRSRPQRSSKASSPREARSPSARCRSSRRASSRVSIGQAGQGQGVLLDLFCATFSSPSASFNAHQMTRFPPRFKRNERPFRRPSASPPFLRAV